MTRSINIVAWPVHQRWKVSDLKINEEGEIISYTTGLPSSVCVVGCAFIMAVSVYQISKTKAEI